MIILTDKKTVTEFFKQKLFHLRSGMRVTTSYYLTSSLYIFLVKTTLQLAAGYMSRLEVSRLED